MKQILAVAAVIVLFIQAVCLVFEVTGHRVNMDEAWLAEQAYFQARDGYAHSELFRGYCHNEERIVLQHRLFILAAAAVVELAGFHLYCLRLMILLFGLVLLLLFWKYIRIHLHLDIQSSLISSAILLLFPLFFLYIGLFRPEIMFTTFGFGSFLCLSGKSSSKTRIALAGILAGLSPATHLNGIIFLIAGFAILLWERRFRDSLIFAGASALVLIPYAIELLRHLPLLKEQLAGELSANKISFTALTPITNLLSEHKRLFRKPETIFTSLLIITSLIATPHDTFKRHRVLYWYFAILAVSLGVLASCKTVTYTVPLLPFGAAAFGLAFFTRNHSLKRYNKLRKIMFAVLVMLSVVYGLFFSISSIFPNRYRPESVNIKAGEIIPDGERCLAPMHFIFGQIDRLEIVGLYRARVTCDDREMSMYYILNYASLETIGFIVLDDYWITHITGCSDFLLSSQDSVQIIKTEYLTVLVLPQGRW